MYVHGLQVKGDRYETKRPKEILWLGRRIDSQCFDQNVSATQNCQEQRLFYLDWKAACVYTTFKSDAFEMLGIYMLYEQKIFMFLNLIVCDDVVEKVNFLHWHMYWQIKTNEKPAPPLTGYLLSV